jgi:hypothetical protein
MHLHCAHTKWNEKNTHCPINQTSCEIWEEDKSSSMGFFVEKYQKKIQIKNLYSVCERADVAISRKYTHKMCVWVSTNASEWRKKIKLSIGHRPYAFFVLLSSLFCSCFLILHPDVVSQLVVAIQTARLEKIILCMKVHSTIHVYVFVIISSSLEQLKKSNVFRPKPAEHDFQFILILFTSLSRSLAQSF